jgi:hypothetical protein
MATWGSSSLWYNLTLLWGFEVEHTAVKSVVRLSKLHIKKEIFVAKF